MKICTGSSLGDVVLGCKPIDMPSEQNFGLATDSDGALVDKARFQRLVKQCIYLSHIHPVISYGVGMVNQFMHASKTSRLEVMNCIV